MSPNINLQCQPSPFIWGTTVSAPPVGGESTLTITDESGTAYLEITKEDGSGRVGVRE